MVRVELDERFPMRKSESWCGCGEKAWEGAAVEAAAMDPSRGFLMLHLWGEGATGQGRGRAGATGAAMEATAQFCSRRILIHHVLLPLFIY